MAHAGVNRQAGDDEQQDGEEPEEHHDLAALCASVRPYGMSVHRMPHATGASRTTVYCDCCWVNTFMVGDVYWKTTRTPSSSSLGWVWPRRFNPKVPGLGFCVATPPLMRKISIGSPLM